ncbi:MAG: glycerol-3-phosphate acyltransferase [Oscillospiraceae bacterium]|nr:glycerol-3-phosphate acyltransferase [Oscillospiraceae bacterium]
MIPALLAGIAVLAYLLGCINATAVMRRIFPRPRARYRRLGYGAEGLLRIWRAYGWWGLGVVVLVDVLKTVAAVLLGGLILSRFSGVDPAETTADYAAVGKVFAMYCVLLGHCYPAFRRFRGGRGTHVAIAALFCINSTVGFFALVLFALIAWFTRYVSLGTVLVSLLAPFLIWVEYGVVALYVAVAASLVLLWRSRRNVLALLRRQEKKFDLAPDLSDKFNTEDF